MPPPRTNSTQTTTDRNLDLRTTMQATVAATNVADVESARRQRMEDAHRFLRNNLPPTTSASNIGEL
jgi:hypothetical protein